MDLQNYDYMRSLQHGGILIIQQNSFFLSDYVLVKHFIVKKPHTFNLNRFDKA